MRRTDEVADGGKKFARPNIQEFLFFFGGWKKSCTTSISLHLLMHNLYPRTPKLNVKDMLTGVQDFRHSHKSILITVSSNNNKLGAEVSSVGL